MVVGEKFQLKHYFDGMPKPEDFTLVKEELPDLKDGEILVSALFLSVDPYMRPYTRRIPLSAYPITMIGQSVQKVIESKDKEFPKGCNIMCNIGWVKTGTYKIRYVGYAFICRSRKIRIFLFFFFRNN